MLLIASDRTLVNTSTLAMSSFNPSGCVCPLCRNVQSRFKLFEVKQISFIDTLELFNSRCSCNS